jgi:4-hydroxy-2-oxoheptanedioate aldolase
MGRSHPIRIANANVLVLPQIETVEAVENLEAILDVPGISGACVGPSDLGLAMGPAPVLDRQGAGNWPSTIA